MKKKLGVLAGIAASLMITGVCAQNEVMNVVNDGYVDITGSGAQAKTKVTLEIIDAGIDLSDYDVWKNYEDNGTTTVYFGSVEADAEGNYEFNIYLPKSGAYVTRIGNEKFETIKVSELNFTNVQQSAEVLKKIKKASEEEDKEEVAALIKENRYAIGLQSKVFEDADFEKTAEYLMAYINDNADEVTSENIGTLCEKAMIMSILDSDEFTDFKKYGTGFGISGLKIEKYYDSDFSEELAKLVKQEKIKSFDDYDEALEEGILVCLVNYNDSVDALSEALLDYADELGISENKITTANCRKLMKNGISSTADIKKELSSGGSDSGSGGGSYSGKASSDSKPSIQLPAVTTENTVSAENQMTEIFTDLEDFEWAKASIEQLYKSGVINGRTSRTFAPADSVLREEFVKMIVGAFKLSVIGDDLSFKDVDKNAWYAEYVACAYHSKIVNGYSNDLFGIGDCITRQDAAVMIVNAAQACDYTFKDNGLEVNFADGAEIADYAKSAVDTLAKAGIINGDQNGCFNPYGKTSRAEAAKLLYMTICNTEK